MTDAIIEFFQKGGGIRAVDFYLIVYREVWK